MIIREEGHSCGKAVFISENIYFESDIRMKEHASCNVRLNRYKEIQTISTTHHVSFFKYDNATLYY